MIALVFLASFCDPIFLAYFVTFLQDEQLLE